MERDVVARQRGESGERRARWPVAGWLGELGGLVGWWVVGGSLLEQGLELPVCSITKVKKRYILSAGWSGPLISTQVTEAVLK